MHQDVNATYDQHIQQRVTDLPVDCLCDVLVALLGKDNRYYGYQLEKEDHGCIREVKKCDERVII